MDFDVTKYIDDVWSFLDKMDVKATITIENIVKQDNMDFFIDTVKYYIDTNPNSGIEFTNDYKKIRKRSGEL